ncbi:MAG TPA: helix-turn-helix transcriptional regulator [Solirubrobacterales bacterium]|nr:helix-turn-helix transcriptional regulator [Solirubrobacterales bacterium]
MQGNARQLSDAWWAERAKRLLHPVQVQIIEIFQRADQSLSVRDLSKVISHLESDRLEHHVGRLKNLGALELVGRPGGATSMDMRYRLTREKTKESTDSKRLAMQFGKNLAASRRRSRLSQKELVSRTGLSGEKINSFEEGEREPALGDVVRLASAFSTSMNDLLRGIEWRPDRRGGGRFILMDLRGGR